MKKILAVLICLTSCIYLYSQSCNITCVSNVNVSLNIENCMRTFTPQDLIQNITGTCSAYYLEFEYPLGTQTFSPANKLSGSHAGYQMNFKIKDSVTHGQRCWGSLRVNYCNPCYFPTPPVVDSFKVSDGPYIPGGTITLQVWATDNKSISKVEFYNWTDLIGTDNTSPYTKTYTFKSSTASQNNFWAIVYDDCGAKDTTDKITVTTTFPKCNDGIKNGEETGIDCGTTACGACYSTPPPIVELPDLVPKDVWPVSSMLSKGVWYTLEGKVKNQGWASSPTTGMYIVLSQDAVFSNNDIPLGQSSVPGLAMNTQTSFQTKFIIPTSVYNGTYYLIACVDPWYNILETDHTNNCYVQQVQIKDQSISKPDLTITYLALDKNMINSGESFKVSFMVNNIGHTTSGANDVAVFLSSNTTVDYGDEKLDLKRVSSIPAGQFIQTESNIHKTLDAGWYYVIVCADVHDEVMESYEYNNCEYVQLKVKDATVSKPDLTISYLALDKSQIYQNEPFKASFMVNNIGGATSGANDVAVYVSDDNDYDASDVKLNLHRVSSLSANTTVIVESNVNKNIAPGWYYIVVCADVHTEVMEQSENNNCQSIRLQVKEHYPHYADLTVSYLSCNKNPVPSGEPFTLSFMVNNMGEESAAPSMTSIFLSQNNELDGNDQMIGEMGISSLPGRKSIFAEKGIKSSMTPGEYFVIVCADGHADVNEDLETNNCTSLALSVTEKSSPKADLTVEIVDFPTQFVANKEGTLKLRISNNGLEKSKENLKLNVLVSYDSEGLQVEKQIQLSIPSLQSVGQAGSKIDMTVGYTNTNTNYEGALYFTICADATNEETEISESNNCTARSSNVVIPYMDLKNITAISYANAINKNAPLVVPFTMTNIGVLPSDTVVVEYYLSFKPLLKSGSAVRLALDTIRQKINSGDTLRRSVSLKVPSYVTGSHYLNICIDPNGKLTEKSKTNNCQTIRVVFSSETGTLQSENKLESRESAVNSIDIYPNPTADLIYFQQEQNSPLKLTLSDMSGKRLIQKIVYTNQLNIQQLPAGMYILSASTGNGFNKLFKVVKK